MMLCRRSGIVLLILLAGRFSVVAQQADTVKGDTAVNDTVVVGAGEAAIKTHLDTSFSASPESEKSAADSLPVLRALPDTLVDHWKHDPKFAYANDPAYWKIRQESQSSSGLWLARVLGSKAFRYTVLMLLGGLLLYAIVRIAMDNNLNLFYRKTARGGFAEEETGRLPPQEDIEQQLQHYLQAGDKRQATRYLYLKALHLLSQRGSINWHVDSTNHEYLRQLKGRPEEIDFRFLTGAYEMVWYGDFVLSENSFGRIHHRFTEFFKTLAS